MTKVQINLPDQLAQEAQNAGLLTERTIVTSLGKLKSISVESPVILIVGDVVKHYQPKEKILFLGLDPWSCKMNRQLVHYPLIEIRELKTKLPKLSRYDAIVFTSKNGVRSILSKHTLKAHKIIAIGQHTKRTVESYGYKVDHLPKRPDSESLAELIRAAKFKKVLYPVSQLSNNVLHRLKNVEAKVVYRTKFKQQPKLDLKNYSGLVFSSASTVKAYFKIYQNIPGHLQLFVYGDHVAAELKKKGYTNVQALPL